MPKRHKIKHYHQTNKSVYKAKPHPLSIIIIIVAVAVLAFVGVSIYRPVYDFIMGKTKPIPPPLVTESSQAEQASLPEVSAVEQPSENSSSNNVAEPLKAVYLPQATASNELLLDAFIKSVAAKDINAVMIEIKDKQGAVLFGTQNPQAAKWGAVTGSPINLAAVSQTLKDNNLRLVVKLSAFKDPIAARGERDNAIRYQDSEWLWLDRAASDNGNPWLNPYAQGARQYITELALEAVSFGAEMVILDDVNFPDGSASGNATFGETQGAPRGEILKQFVQEISTAVEEKGGRVGVYLETLAVTSTAQNTTRYGGSPLLILKDSLILAVLPYQFGGGYSAEGLEIVAPMQNPDAAVAASLGYVKNLWEKSAAETVKSKEIIALIQGGVEPDKNAVEPFTKQQLESQIALIEGSGGGEYILYSTTGKYLFE